MEKIEEKIEKKNDEMLENEFIKKVNDVYKQCVNNETYGETTEFFDEDGVVLMTATAVDGHKIVFSFSDSEAEQYCYEEKNIEE